MKRYQGSVDKEIFLQYLFQFLDSEDDEEEKVDLRRKISKGRVQKKKTEKSDIVHIWV